MTFIKPTGAKDKGYKKSRASHTEFMIMQVREKLRDGRHQRQDCV